MKLHDNQWGFDISLNNPFRIFRLLREEAVQSVSEPAVVDLSRGDPGYGFSPSVSGREFYALLLHIDTFLNSPGNNFVVDNHDDFSTIWEKIQNYVRSLYKEKTAEHFLEKFYFFLTRIEKYAAHQGLNWDKRKILLEIFKYSTVSGGCYHDPQGETLTRLVVAQHHNELLNLRISYKDLVFIKGVSDGIGTLFKLLCDERVKFLEPGDTVVIISPAYAPYNTIMENRGLKVFPIPLDCSTGSGSIDGDLETLLKNVPENMKLICVIDPNNPTGFMFEENFLERMGRFAEERNALIISDEVYSDFFFARKKSMLSFARNRTIVLNGRSKIERCTGLRFAEFIIAEEADEYISHHLFQGRLDGNANLKALLVAAKAPGGIRGEFQHTTFVPGPSQYLGISHVIFGDEDRQEYLRRIRVNMESFYEILGLPYLKNFYYANFDLLNIPGNKKHNIPPEEIFLGLAKRGVVLIPSNLFYSKEEREKKDYRYFARASLANLSFTQLQKAAHLIKEYLCQ